MSPDVYRLLLSFILNSVFCALVALLAGSWSSGIDGRARGFAQKFTDASPYPRLRDVGGLRRAKAMLMTRAVVPLRMPTLFAGPMRAAGLPPLRGAILSGPPGTGKTMLARAVANEAGVPLLQVRLADVESKFYGEAAKNLRAAFDAAKSRAPAVLFFDEIDGMVRHRAENESSATYGLKTELLQHLDGISEFAVFVIACTNCPTSLDAAIARRLPNAIRLNKPSCREREHILQLILRRNGESEAAAKYVAPSCEGCSGSDLESIVEAALFDRYRRALLGGGALDSLGPLTKEDWSAALRSFTPS